MPFSVSATFVTSPVLLNILILQPWKLLAAEHVPNLPPPPPPSKKKRGGVTTVLCFSIIVLARQAYHSMSFSKVFNRGGCPHYPLVCSVFECSPRCASLSFKVSVSQTKFFTVWCSTWQVAVVWIKCLLGYVVTGRLP